MPAGLVIRCNIVKVKAKMAKLSNTQRCHVQPYQTGQYGMVPVQYMQYPCLYGSHVLRPAVIELVLACIAAKLPVLPSIHYAVPAFQASRCLMIIFISHFIMQFI